MNGNNSVIAIHSQGNRLVSSCGGSTVCMESKNLCMCPVLSSRCLSSRKGCWPRRRPGLVGPALRLRCLGVGPGRGNRVPPGGKTASAVAGRRVPGRAARCAASAAAACGCGSANAEPGLKLGTFCEPPEDQDACFNLRDIAFALGIVDRRSISDMSSADVDSPKATAPSPLPTPVPVLVPPTSKAVAGVS